MLYKCIKHAIDVSFEKKVDLEPRLEKTLNDVNSFNNSINKIKEMITYFKDKNNKSRKK